MATIQKRGDKWYAIFRDAQGVWRQRVGYHDKAETLRLARRLEDEADKVRSGDIDPRAEQRRVERSKGIAAHVEEYKAALQAKGNSANHVSYTIADINLFIAFASVSHAEAITRAMLDQWVLKLTEAGADSRSTINRRVGSVKAFLKHLHQVGTLADYVLFKYAKLKTQGHEKRKRRALSVAEQAKLLRKAPDERRELYRFVLLTGARHTQCVALTVDDVNFSAGTITLKSKDNQHRNRVQVVPMHDDLVRPLKRLAKGKARGEALFVVPTTRDAAKLVQADCAAAGVDATHVDFHALRHSFITTLAEMNVHPKLLQELAGHADLETTLKYYVHFKRSDERAAVAMLKLPA
jgi:integrase